MESYLRKEFSCQRRKIQVALRWCGDAVGIDTDTDTGR